MGGIIVEGVETSHNSYLDILLPRLAQEEAPRSRKIAAEVSSTSLSPSASNSDSRATSEVPWSAQPSPYTASSGAWPNTSPMKSLEEESDSSTPTKDSLTSRSATPTSSHATYQPPSQYDSPEKSVTMVTSQPLSSHPLQIQHIANEGGTPMNISEQASDGEVDTSQSIPLLKTPPPTSNDMTSDKHYNTATTSTDSSTITTDVSPPQLVPAGTAMEGTVAPPPLSQSSHTHSHPVVSSSPSTQASASPWFSLTPRKPCEMLHMVQASGAVPGGQQQYMMQGGYAYMTPEGAVISQPMLQQMQMTYAVMGNTLVPQTQYIVQNPSSVVGGASGSSQQFIALGNGQIAAIQAPTGSNAIQYITMGGNQYAVIPQGMEQGSEPVITEVSEDLETKSEPEVNSDDITMTTTSHSVGKDTIIVIVHVVHYSIVCALSL